MGIATQILKPTRIIISIWNQEPNSELSTWNLTPGRCGQGFDPVHVEFAAPSDAVRHLRRLPDMQLRGAECRLGCGERAVYPHRDLRRDRLRILLDMRRD